MQENLHKMYHSMIKFDAIAQVVKLVDTRDLKSLEGNFVPVQVRPWAPLSNTKYEFRDQSINEKNLCNNAFASSSSWSFKSW